MDKRTKQSKQSEEHRVEIKSWLDSEERDFDHGYNLFVRFSHNRALALMLVRTKRLSKLVYELQKITDRAFIQHSPVMPLKTITNASKRHQENTEAAKLVESAGKLFEHKADDVVSDKLLEVESGADDVISDKLDEFKEATDDILSEQIQIVRDGKIVKLGDLPENLRELWKLNRDEHKLMRAIHEKMKLAKGDNDRAVFRKQLVDFDDRLSKRWAVIDEWFKVPEAVTENEDTGENQTKTEEQPGTGGDGTETESVEMQDLKDINAARSYLSRNVKKVDKLEGEKKDILLKKLADRVAILQKHKAEISRETTAELVKLGLLEDKGNE